MTVKQTGQPKQTHPPPNHQKSPPENPGISGSNPVFLTAKEESFDILEDNVKVANENHPRHHQQVCACEFTEFF